MILDIHIPDNINEKIYMNIYVYTYIYILIVYMDLYKVLNQNLFNILLISTYISLIFKYASLSSMFGSLTVFVINFLRETVISSDPSLVSSVNVTDSKLLFIFFILIMFSHKKNILNLKNKTENKIKI